LISAISIRLLVRFHAPSYGEGGAVDQNPPMATSTAPGDRTRSAAVLVLASIVAVQCGSALATGLFDEVGTAGAVFLRAAFGALALVALTRGTPLRTRGWPHRDVLLLAVAVACVNLFFYAALERLPLGIAVTLEFVGPLGVAIAGSRRPRDAIWVVLGATGIVLLADVGGGGVDALGVVLALTAGFFWGAYIVLSDRVGALAPGVGGATMAAVLSALLVAPLGVAQGGAEILHPAVLAVGAAVGVLSTAIPYAFEMEALRRLPRAVFGVLMSLEPAVAAAIGFLALSQGLDAIEVLAIGLVVGASAGALRSAAAPPPHDG
jgi:inner membrane transporter RhtA